MTRIAVVLLVAIVLVVTAICATFIAITSPLAGGGTANSILWLGTAVLAILLAVVVVVKSGRETEEEEPPRQ